MRNMRILLTIILYRYILVFVGHNGHVVYSTRKRVYETGDIVIISCICIDKLCE